MACEVDLTEKLTKWLGEHGYPLEMRVASVVRKYTRFDIRQGWHYIDPESGNSREIDIVCTAPEPRGMAEINFVIECKATKKPWVIFASEDAASSYHRLNAFGLFSQAARSAVAERLFSSDLYSPADYEDAKSIPWLWKEGLVGYAITQAFEGNNDVPYVASMSCIKASIWLLSQSLWQSAEYRTHSISFPIIVTTSPLFECTLKDDGSLALCEIGHGHLFFKQHINEFFATCISVVTESHLETFLKECQVVADRMYEAMDESLGRDWDEFCKRARLNAPNT